MTTQQTMFDFTVAEAKAKGLRGAEKAADHAGNDWKDQALAWFVGYAESVGTPFLSEEARKFAEEAGFDLPPDARAWGHVAKSAERMGKVQFAGYGPSKSSNGSPKVLWKLAAK